MTKYFFRVAVAVGVYFTQAGWGTEPEGENELISARDSINVTHYPAPLQSTYDLFVARCSTCHGLKDTIQSPEVLPSYWEKTVQDMYEKKDSGISTQDVQAITEFLIYDAYKRRSFKYKRDLRELPPEKQKMETEKLEAILKKFQGS